MTGPAGTDAQWPDLLPAPRPRGRAGVVEATLLVVAGFSLVLATLVDTPWVSVLTLPAALLAPGHVLLRVAAARLTAEPWFAWALRVLLSLAVWTLLGAVFAITPGLDPRVVPLLVGPVLVLVGLSGRANRHPLLTRPAAEADDPDLPGQDGAGAPGGAGSSGGPGARGGAGVPSGSGSVAGREQPAQDPRTLAGRLVTVAIVGVVAAGSLFAGYRIVTGAPAGPGYVSLALTPPELPVYDGQGRLTPAVEIRNGTGRPVRVSLDLRVDGRLLPRLTVGPVPAGRTATAALGPVRLPGCWTRLTITVVGRDLGKAAPRPLVLPGPRGDLPTCPATP